MIVFIDMLVPAAKEAGMKIPLNVEIFYGEDFPHFVVFMKTQLGARMPSPNSHWNNASIIAKFRKIRYAK